LVEEKALLRDISKKGLKQGVKVEGTVSLLKDYGTILSLKGGLTGFIIKDNQKGEPENGQKVAATVLDADFQKGVVDLTMKLTGKESSEPLSGKHKLVVELNKEDYLVVACKTNRQILGYLSLMHFNRDDRQNPHQNIEIGDEFEGEVVADVGGSLGFVESRKPSEFKEGSLVSGTITSIMDYCFYVKFPSTSRQVIGRLHKLECPDFENYQVGDRVKVKVIEE